MFLYTSFEILLYVVSIFNTSANVKSYLIFIRIPYSPIISLLIVNISGLLILSPAKVSYITGTSICRTTDILMKN